MIELKNVTVKFSGKENDVYAAKNVNLHVEKKDVYGIIGYSGAGKSTLVRTVNLLQEPTSGKVIVAGEELTSMSAKNLREKRKRIGMIFQHFNLLKSKTVRENILFPLKQSGLSKNEKDKKVDRLLELVGLSDKASSYPSQLSGGQKQRVAIARALANDPEILLCDEATSALDPQTTDDVLNLLKRLNQDLNLTILLITHEMYVIKEICNKVAIMDSGEIIESGKIVDVFSRPQNELTKSFINTATQMDSALEKVLGHESILHLDSSSLLARITYVGANTSQPIISTLNSQFHIVTNILSGSIEFLQGTPIGSLIVSFSGDEKQQKKAVAYLKETGITVEIIRADKMTKGVKHA